MRNLRENVASAFRALRENWLRTTLTMLGIIIGVGSVVLLVALGQGVKQDLTGQLNLLGTNVAFILPGKLDKNGQPNMLALAGISTLTEQDARDLGQIPGINLSVPLMFVSGTLEHGKNSSSAIVLAAPPAIAGVRTRHLEGGRFLQPQDAEADVCVLAHDPKAELFGDEPAVGETVTVRGVPFKVIGTLQPEEPSLFAALSFANIVYMPFETARKRYGQQGQINRIILKTDYTVPPDPLLRKVKERLLANHGGREDFGLLTPGQILNATFRVFDLVTLLLAGISAISLVVAGIGIMNIMLVTVTERTREIGVRKTVGARRQDIFVQFLTEAVTLAFVGGVVGTLLASGLCLVVAARTPLHPVVTTSSILMAFGVCFAVGVVFGVAPAVRAARKDPIEALRWE